MATSQEKAYTTALDAGGTMTDTVIVDEKGAIAIGKALTNREDESASYMESVADACHYAAVSTSEMHKRGISCTYTGTTMLNLLLTRSGSKVGLLTTKGQKHVPVLERGLDWLGLSHEDQMHLVLDEHTPWLVDIRHIKDVAERIKGPSYYPGCHLPPDAVVVPLNEEDVRRGVDDLLDEGVQVVGILFLHSYADPAHELRAAAIAREIIVRRGLQVPVVTSYEICPVSMESQRAKSLLLHCYAALPAQEQLFRVEKAARDDGYRYDMTTLLAYGGIASMRYPKMYEAVISGPAGGVIGAKTLLVDAKGIENVVCTDLGGTSFDVGIITKRQMAINAEPIFAGHKLNLPMLAIDSIAAGSGMVVHVDQRLRRIELGPESAGALVGTCYKYPEITISDLDVILGYLNPDYFLGGAVKLNKEAALEAVEGRLAKPLDQDVYDVSAKVLDILHSNMRDHIGGTLMSRGLNPADYTVIAYGGSGPLHMWGLGEGLKFGGLVTVPWAAAFSAYGVACSEYFHRYQKSVLCVLPGGAPGDFRVNQAQALNQAWQELEEKANEELQREGFAKSKITFRYGIYARYLGQMASWEAPVPKGRVATMHDLDDIVGAFEASYASIYPLAARLPEAGYVITGAVVEAVAERIKPALLKYELQGKSAPPDARKGQRDVYHKGRWTRFDLWDMDRLQAGNRIDGPAIFEHPMTTFVIPPQNYVEFDEHKVIWYKSK